MKTALLILYLTGSLFVAVFGASEIRCGANMVSTACAPCNQVCNEPPRACALFCLSQPSFCVCQSGYSLPKSDSTYCIPTKKCSSKCNQ